jgi:hypothetical protein
MEMQRAVESERAHIELALKNLRQFYPGKTDAAILSEVLRSDEALTPETLAKFARQRKRFSTADVTQHFQVNNKKAAGSLAALTRIKRLRFEGTNESGHSLWVWVK